GYAAEGRSPLLTRAVHRTGPARSMPRTREYAVLAEAAGLDVGPGIPRLVPLERDLKTGKRLALSGRYAVVAPGASFGPAKQWGPERFAKAAQDIAARGLSIVLVGSRDDTAAAQSTIRALEGASTHDLTGATDLSTLVGVLAGAD